MKRIRRCVCIFHQDFEPDTPEAIEQASIVCNGMKAAGRAMVDEAVKDLKRIYPEIDESKATELAMGFEFKIMKVETL